MSERPSARFVVKVVIGRPLDQSFTYEINEADLARAETGAWVKVPFGKSEILGFLVSKPEPLNESTLEVPVAKLRKIAELSPDGSPFSPEIWSLCEFVRDYYRAPFGEVLQAAVPGAALGLKSVRRQSRAVKAVEENALSLAGPLHPFTSEQTNAIKEIWEKPSGTTLLEGVTGSGKTEVYLEIARRTLREGRSVLVLVPEIALTPQLHERFEKGLGEKVALWHSALSDGMRRDLFSALKRGEIRAVVGARSAVFAPLDRPGLIVVDEEHDQTYKQEERVRYQARDLAVKRGLLAGSRVVLGSATPSLETLERTREKRYAHVFLRNRVTGAVMPEIQVLTLEPYHRPEGSRTWMHPDVLGTIKEVLARGEQVIVFLNRRGYANYLLCSECGDVKKCPQCSVSLTFHKAKRRLKCHYCGHFEKVPEQCEKCQSIELEPMGSGTESVEEELIKWLPEAKLIRLDRDQVTSATRLDEILSDFRTGKANLMLGTQMLVKGHDFPGVTLVVVLLADSLFQFPDFRAEERALQVLTQVSGRAGRGQIPGRVLIQTFQPERPLFEALTNRERRAEFLEEERSLRQVLNYPPFGRLTRVRFEATEKEDALAIANRVADGVRAHPPFAEVLVLGPSEPPLERFQGKYRMDVLLKAKEVGVLHQAISFVKNLPYPQNVERIIDVDPSGIS